MLDQSLHLPSLARHAHRNAASSPNVGFPSGAFAFWEGQGQSNMTGFNEVGDAPASLRIVNPDIEMLTPAGGWPVSRHWRRCRALRGPSITQLRKAH